MNTDSSSGSDDAQSHAKKNVSDLMRGDIFDIPVGDTPISPAPPSNPPQKPAERSARPPRQRPRQDRPSGPRGGSSGGQSSVEAVTSRRRKATASLAKTMNQLPTDKPPRLSSSQGKFRTIILGGLNEVGLNCTVFEYDGDLLIVDVGLSFPDEEKPGVDYIIPDPRYLIDRIPAIKGIVITHAHLDHIGAIAQILPMLEFPPIFTMDMSAGMIKKRLAEHKLEDKAIIDIVNPDTDVRKAGKFHIEFFRVNHSIPDCMGVYVKTPVCKVVHTGDFKFDQTPADGLPADEERISKIGDEGIDILFCESTNATKPGSCPSEKEVGENLGRLIREAKGRIILTSFSSLVSRLQQIADHAVESGRTIFVAGRSMAQTLEIAIQEGKFRIPSERFQKLDAVDSYDPRQVLILTTGSQGEENAALRRMAEGQHQSIVIEKTDTIIFSSNPIPGNERGVTHLINLLLEQEATVITHGPIMIHVTGHGYQEEIKKMHRLIRPKNVVPIHGELFMRHAHKQLCTMEMGYDPERVILLKNGSVLEYNSATGFAEKSSESLSLEDIYVDGKLIGDTGRRILQERCLMRDGGVLILLYTVDRRSKRLIAPPEVISKGFIFLQGHSDYLSELQNEARISYDNAQKESANLRELKRSIERGMNRFILKTLEREPYVIPVLQFGSGRPIGQSPETQKGPRPQGGGGRSGHPPRNNRRRRGPRRNDSRQPSGEAPSAPPSPQAA